MQNVLVIFSSSSAVSSLNLITKLMQEISPTTQIVGVTEKDILTKEKIEEQDVIVCFTSSLASLQTMENFAKAIKTNHQKVITAGMRKGVDLELPITKEKLFSAL